MMVVVEALKEFLFEGDLQERYLIKYSALPLSTIAFYILFVKWLGPLIMKDRKPFDLKYTMILYNFMQCFGNAYIVYQLVQFDIKYSYGWCLAKQNPDIVLAVQEGKKTAWLLFLLKYIDLIDTVFFVLRKKESQITMLHVFHHTMVCLLSWWFIRALTNLGYYICLGMTLNTAIHVIMYFYYGLAAFGPSVRKYLWWKHYLTQLQIIQFFATMLYLLFGFYTGCEELGATEVISFLFTFAICVMFLDFYRKDNQRHKHLQSITQNKTD